MTKEEILKKGMSFNEAGESLSDSNWNVLVKYDSAIIAMEEYAKQQCDELRERLLKANNLLEYAGRINNHDMGFEVDLLDYFELPKI